MSAAADFDRLNQQLHAANLVLFFSIAASTCIINTNMSFTEIPLRLPGVVLASAMPFSGYDPDGELLELFCDLHISAVVVLCTLEEILSVSGRDLPALYASAGMQVISLPIADLGTPDLPALESAVRVALEHVSAGGNLAVHCHAGVGRTGLFTACLASRVQGIAGEQALQWIRQFIPHAIETEKQRQLLVEFGRAAC